MYYDSDLLRIYSRFGSFAKCAKYLGISKETWSQHWYATGLPSPKATRPPCTDEDLERYTIAIISDLHLGSVYQQPTLLDNFIQECKDRNIDWLVCAGDTIEGIMTRPGSEEERFLHTTNEFEQYAQHVYPEGFKHSFLLNGNHEWTLNRYEPWYNFSKELCYRRHDLTYLSQAGMFLGPGNVLFRVYHRGSMCGKPGQPKEKRLKQNALQLIADGPRFDVLLAGHCHRSTILKSWMGKTIISCGCFQSATKYLAEVYGGVDLGGTILSYCVQDGILCNINVEWISDRQLGGICINDW